MKISDIKQAIRDPQAQAVVKKDMWTSPIFGDALHKYQGEANQDAIYEEIKDTYIDYLRAINDKVITLDKDVAHTARKQIRRLSGKLYNNKSYWAKDTEFETSQ